MNRIVTPLFSILTRRVAIVMAIAGLSLSGVDANAQYCAASATCTNDFIQSVTTTGGCSNILNLNTGCSATNGYSDFTGTQVHHTQKNLNVFFSIVLGGNTTSKFLRIWVDYNGDQTFASTESVYFSTTGVPGGSTVTGSFTVPNNATAVPGLTRMRIRVAPSSAPAANGACGSTPANGEVEDYGFEIAPTAACSGAPTGGVAGTVAPNNTVCYNTGTTLTLSGSTCAASITYQWKKLVGGAWTPIANATNPSASTGNITEPTDFHAVLTCSGLSDSSADVTVLPDFLYTPYLETFEGIPANNTLPQCMSATAFGTNVVTYTTNQATLNRTNHTPGGSKYASFKNVAASTFLYTPAIYLETGKQYQLSFWYITDGFAGWNNFAAYYGPTASPGGMVNQIASVAVNGQPPLNNTTYQQFVSNNIIPTADGPYFVGIYSLAAPSPNQYLTVDDISVIELPACTAMPDAGTVFPTGSVSLCTGLTTTITTIGSTAASNLAYQWQASTDGLSYTDVIGGTGYDAQSFTTPPNYVTTYYRLKLTCTNTGDIDYSDSLKVEVIGAQYAAIPFTETFETWTDRCNTTDVPSANWATVPATGNPSWRRDDQGASANWSSPSVGANFPASAEGSHSARFHSTYATPAATRGNLDLLVNCGGITGDVELQFYYMNTSGLDSMKIYVSTDGGANFNYLAGLGQASLWALQSFMFTSTSPQTIIRFQGKSDGISSGSDIGIDAVQVLPPCGGMPDAGTITTALPCAGETFGLSLTGGTPASGLTYEWQQAISPTGPWASVPGGIQPILSTTISDTTYFRVIVTCVADGSADTSAVQFIPTANFYYCYCTSNATNATGTDIGNFTVRTSPGGYPILNNGVGTPLTGNPNANNVYSNFNTLPPIVTYLDSTLRFIITQNNTSAFQAATAAIFIDLNHDGSFDVTEKIFERLTANTTIPPQQVDTIFTIPSNTPLGITGLRLVLVQGTGSVNSCGSYSNGETEDYLIDVHYHPCDGPANPGTAVISDTTGCVGYKIIVSDITHQDSVSNIEWIWQISGDGNAWSDVANSTNKDSIEHIMNGPAYFRLKMICFKPTAIDVTYSNVVNVNIGSPYACYCFSQATGEEFDSSDNSLFKIGQYEILTPGPHLLNPTAVNARTNFTDVSNFELWVDTTYTIEVYHTIFGPYHGDAKVTLFMDYNNDFMYSTAERVWTAYTTSNNYYLTTNITIPSDVITGLKTGMRLILNNDIGASAASDSACGTYISGETEDYVVTFRNALLGVHPTAMKLSSVDIYPNPSKGLFNLDLHGSQALGDAQIIISNVTGQQIATYDYRNLDRNFGTKIDLSGQAKGVYFVEVKAGGDKVIRKVMIQ